MLGTITCAELGVEQLQPQSAVLASPALLSDPVLGRTRAEPSRCLHRKGPVGEPVSSLAGCLSPAPCLSLLAGVPLLNPPHRRILQPWLAVQRNQLRLLPSCPE